MREKYYEEIDRIFKERDTRLAIKKSLFFFAQGISLFLCGFLVGYFLR